jgi:predicted outer membrane repeat protein
VFTNNFSVEATAIGSWGSLVIRNSTFSNNLAHRGSNPTGGGALALFSSCTAEISGSTFFNNRTTGFAKGGAIITHGALSIINSTFSGNHADTHGGAISIEQGMTTLTHVTLAGNTTNTEGAGIYVNREGQDKIGTLNVRNTIIANNTGALNCAGSGTITNSGNNLRFPANDASCPGIVGDPKLSALANNGGATQTMALQPGSAALEKIPAANGCGVGVTIDQRGVPRPQGTACDIGAFELQAPAEVPEADTLLLLGGGLGGLATWLRYQWSRRKNSSANRAHHRE